jgi:hypothetical protein
MPEQTYHKAELLRPAAACKKTKFDKKINDSIASINSRRKDIA